MPADLKCQNSIKTAILADNNSTILIQSRKIAYELPIVYKTLFCILGLNLDLHSTLYAISLFIYTLIVIQFYAGSISESSQTIGR